MIKKLSLPVLFGCLFLIFAMIFTVMSCSSPTTSTTTTSPKASTTPMITTTATPQYGGVLKILSSPGLMNIGAPGKPAGIADLGYERPAVENLFMFNIQDVNKPLPWLVDSYQLSPDYKSLTLTLKKNVKFHDGTDFNADAVKYNLDKQRTGTGNGASTLVSVQSVDVIDPYTVRLNFTQYDPTILYALCSDGGLQLSPTSVEKMGIDAAMTHPVGTGPFKFASYQRDVSLKYERFDDYWGGKPYLDGWEVDFIADPVVALTSFKAGEAQILMDPSPKNASDLKAAGYNINSFSQGVEALIGDSANPDSPFSKIEVRQAISYAIDNGAVAKLIGSGFYTATNQLSAPGSYCYNPAVVGYPYDPQKAKDLLARAGYPTGFSTTITFMSNPTNQDMFTAVQGFLKNVNVSVVLDPADTGRFMTTRTQWKNQLVHFMFQLKKDAGQSTGFKMNLSGVRTQYKSADLPADFVTLFNNALYESDLPKRQSMFQDLVKMEVDKYCLTNPIMASNGVLAYSPKVNNLNMYTIDKNTLTAAKVWLSK